MWRGFGGRFYQRSAQKTASRQLRQRQHKPEKFEKAALFLLLGLPSTLIRNKSQLFENAFQIGGIWKRRQSFFVFVWTA